MTGCPLRLSPASCHTPLPEEKVSSRRRARHAQCRTFQGPPASCMHAQELSIAKHAQASTHLHTIESALCNTEVSTTNYFSPGGHARWQKHSPDMSDHCIMAIAPRCSFRVARS